MSHIEPPKWTDKAIVFLTIGIVFLAFMQWREMVGAGEQTDKLIRAAQIQADAASKNITAAQNFAMSASDAVKELRRAADDSERSIQVNTQNATQALRISQRPYLTIGGVQFDPPIDQNHNPAIIKIQIHNSGRTPALNETEEIDSFVGDTKSAASPPAFPGGSTIASDRDVIVSMFLSLIHPGDYEAVMAGTSKLRLRGHITYADIFKQSHVTRFCVAWDVKEKNWKFCEGNEVL